MFSLASSYSFPNQYIMGIRLINVLAHIFIIENCESAESNPIRRKRIPFQPIRRQIGQRLIWRGKPDSPGSGGWLRLSLLLCTSRTFVYWRESLPSKHAFIALLLPAYPFIVYRILVG